ncbi:PIG-L family deacetylase [Actinoplanes sp. NPDC049316]|uniref:PIG-L family deacetylase n=1 Tax=Actinoplanes sp. NPDC049316 TaxID=3154727 RepID=UPI003423C8A6
MGSGPTNPADRRSGQGFELTGDVERVLAVVAHPDDESFALGAVLDGLVARGVPVSLLCFTHGEASTLHGRAGDLATLRDTELRSAAAVLGVEPVELLDYPDGRLDRHPLDDLAGHVRRLIAAQRPSHLLVFDTGGVTAHPDHQQATRAALAAARATGRAVLAWALPQDIAERLNDEFGAAFAGRRPDEIDVRLTVSRTRQRRAIAAHRSQSLHNHVLHRRLALQRDREHLRVLYQPSRGGLSMSYAYTARLPQPFSAAVVDRVRAALKDQGFGVLTEIDIQATLQAKLGAAMEDYVILGACNPPLAHRALDIDREIGLLLPCNVVVRADGTGATLVQALDPQTMVQVTGRPELKAVADDAATRLRAALDQLGG